MILGGSGIGSIKLSEYRVREFIQREDFGTEGNVKTEIVNEEKSDTVHFAEPPISPTNAVVLSVLTLAREDPDKIHQILVFAQTGRYLFKLGIIISDHNRLCML